MLRALLIPLLFIPFAGCIEGVSTQDAGFTIPAAALGDTTTYEVTYEEGTGDDGAAFATTYRAGGASFNATGAQGPTDEVSTQIFVQDEENDFEYEWTTRLRSGTSDFVSASITVRDQGNFSLVQGLPFDVGRFENAVNVSLTFYEGRPDCLLAGPFAGRTVPRSGIVEAPCQVPLPFGEQIHLLMVDRWQTKGVVVVDEEPALWVEAENHTLSLYFSADHPFPVRVEFVDQGLATYTATKSALGSGGAGPGSWSGSFPVARQAPLAPWGPDEQGIEHVFPASVAFAHAAPRMGGHLNGEPFAIQGVYTSFLALINERVWNLVLSDGVDARHVKVTQRAPPGTPEALVPLVAEYDVEVGDPYDGEVTAQESFGDTLTVASAFERVAYLGGAASAWMFVSVCVADCEQMEVLVGTIASSLQVQRPPPVTAVSRADVHVFSASGVLLVSVEGVGKLTLVTP